MTISHSCIALLLICIEFHRLCITFAFAYIEQDILYMTI